MPLYEYQCDTCKTVFEIRQKFADEPLTVHENCGGPVKRLLSAPALMFKGSGWYITDYGKGNSSGTAASKAAQDSKDSKAESKSSDSKSEGKSETKSESKTESKSAPAPSTSSTSSSSSESKK